MQRLAPSLMPATRYVSNMIGRILPSPRTSSNAFQSQSSHLSRKFTINSLEILFKGVGSTFDREEHQLARRETHPLESTASLLWHKQHCPGRHSLCNIYFFVVFSFFHYASSATLTPAAFWISHTRGTGSLTRSRQPVTSRSSLFLHTHTHTRTRKHIHTQSLSLSLATFLRLIYVY